MGKNVMTDGRDLTPYDFEGPWVEVRDYIDSIIEDMGIEPETAEINVVHRFDSEEFELVGVREMTAKEKAAELKKKQKAARAAKVKALKLKQRDIVAAIKLIKELGGDTSDLDVALLVVNREIAEPPNGS